MNADHKQVAKSMRAFLKESNIKALCDMTMNGSSRVIRVCVPSYESTFTPSEIAAFCTFAKDTNLTFVRGTEIDPYHESALFHKQQWNFYL